MESFYTNLETVLNINSVQAQALVTGFKTGNLAFFQGYFNALPTVKLEAGNARNNTVSETLYIEGDHIGEGGYGAIFKNRMRPYVYKIIVDYKRVNANSYQYLTTNFKEAIIQTLLLSDPKYGRYVCKLYKVLRQGDDFVFQMEPLETTFEKYRYKNRFEESTPKVVEKVLFKLIEILNYFFVKYRFSHNDLSTDNIMISNDADIESLRLIDFGKSTAGFNDIQIGKISKTLKDTKSLFITNKYYIEPDKRELFNKLVNLPPETPLQTLKNALSRTKGSEPKGSEPKGSEPKGGKRKSKTRKNNKQKQQDVSARQT